MNTRQFNLFETFEDQFVPEFPLFNLDLLRRSESNEEFTFIENSFPFGRPDAFEDVLQKKVKTAEAPKKRGRKPAPKNPKNFDDPTVTIEEIISNDLAGVPMNSEVAMKEKQLQKMREKKALKKIERERGTTLDFQQKNFDNEGQTQETLALEPLIEMGQVSFPQLMFKDGKIVVNEQAPKNRELKLAVNSNEKPFKLTSMSFRTKNHTPRWTQEETNKFYKAIEIFGADFSMIAKLFPGRTRDQIKNKFNKEEKTNLFAMDAAFEKHTSNNRGYLKNKMQNFCNTLDQELALEAVPEVNVGLERNLSNISVGTLETAKIMDEVQEIFLKDIRQQTQTRALALTSFNPIQEKKQVENVVTFEKKNEFGFLQKGDTFIQSKENLLFRFMT